MASASPSIVHAAVDLWVRYLVPLTALSAVALAPVLAIALRVSPPADQAGASAILRTGWGLLVIAWLGQLALVGAAAAIARDHRSELGGLGGLGGLGELGGLGGLGGLGQLGQLGQLGALGRGLVQLARAVVPCLAAAAAIALGCLALVVPGLVLIVVLALIGASPTPGVTALAALADSIAAARRRLPAVAITVAGMLALDVAIAGVAQHLLVVTLSRPPAQAQLAALPRFVHVVALALVVTSPIPASVLAVIRRRADPPAS
ncbi:MAG TPA: hypothetical protein VH165_18090 [Kofleriaceae bacterium]|nr:hypothetical protein [Kofleriaceae bacterium]